MSEPPFPDAVPGLPMPDLGGLMDQLQRVQETQAAEYEGQAGGGAVKIRATGGFEFRSVTISRDAVDPDDVEMLQDLVVAALHDLVANINAAAHDAMGSLGGVPGMPGLPGLSAGPGPSAIEGESGDEPPG